MKNNSYRPEQSRRKLLPISKMYVCVVFGKLSDFAGTLKKGRMSRSR